MEYMVEYSGGGWSGGISEVKIRDNSVYQGMMVQLSVCMTES